MSDPIIERWNAYLLSEGLDEKCNRYFDPDTGHFTSKEKAAQKGGTYSISQKASEKCGDKEAKPGKMKVTGTGKLKPKFTLAQCGRTDAQTGGKKPKDKSKDGSAEVSRRRVRAAPVCHCANHVHGCFHGGPPHLIGPNQH